MVIDGDYVLVVQGPTTKHIVPGGRLRPKDTLEDPLQREVLEESGWHLACYRRIGILHFTHTDAALEGWSNPHPDFLQILYAGSPGEYHPDLK